NRARYDRVIEAGKRARSACDRVFCFSSRGRHTRSYGDWSSDVCSSDLDRSSGTCPCSRPRRAAAPAPAESGRSTPIPARPSLPRSEERRVGKEGRCLLVADERRKKVVEHEANTGDPSAAPLGGAPVTTS